MPEKDKKPKSSASAYKKTIKSKLKLKGHDYKKKKKGNKYVLLQLFIINKFIMNDKDWNSMEES